MNKSEKGLDATLNHIYLNTDNKHDLNSSLLSLETPQNVTGKQYRPRSDAAEWASDQGVHCLLII